MDFNFASAAAGFLMGVFMGAAGKYLADKYTDQRRTQEATKSARTEFTQVEKQMPELIAEFRQDLTANPLVRDFFVLPNRRVALGGSSTPSFVYYEEEHHGLMSKIRILENRGYIRDISVTNTPKYSMMEEFVRLVMAKSTK